MLNRWQGNGEMVVGDGMVGRSKAVRREACRVQDVPLDEKWHMGAAKDIRARPAARVGADGSEPTDVSQDQHGPTGVRASVVARKRGNARGAKGRRKVDAE